MEELIHYAWKHKMFPLSALKTHQGQALEVIDVGLHNRHAGPDFFNAKVKIDGVLWVGNVELHVKSSDWYAHGHDKDAHYDNVILHVCEMTDAELYDHQGRLIPQFVLPIPPLLRQSYDTLRHTAEYPPCYRVIPQLSSLMIHGWMNALQVERLAQKERAILQRLAQNNGSWEAAYFATLARNFGFGVNSDTFEVWALHLPLQQIAHHRDNLFQLEALFLGQAGLLCEEAIPNRYRQQTLDEGYFLRLKKEYLYLQHKFNLVPIDYHLWRFLRLRPQNFPHIRLAQLANLYYQRRTELSQLTDCLTVESVGNLLQTDVTTYWKTHYTFGVLSKECEKKLSPHSLLLLVINTAIPMLFAYGRYLGREEYVARCFSFFEQLKAEDNHIVRLWRACGLAIEHAGDAQALIQLKNEYCDKRECLRCRIGYEYLKRTTLTEHVTTNAVQTASHTIIK